MSNGPARDESGRISWLHRQTWGQFGHVPEQGHTARNVPVEADFKIGQPLGKVGCAPDLPVGELACCGGNKAVRISLYKNTCLHAPSGAPCARTSAGMLSSSLHMSHQLLLTTSETRHEWYATLIQKWSSSQLLGVIRSMSVGGGYKAGRATQQEE